MKSQKITLEGPERTREEHNLRKVDLFDPYAPRGPTTSLFKPGPNPIAGIERLFISMLEQIQFENGRKAHNRQTGPPELSALDALRYSQAARIPFNDA